MSESLRYFAPDGVRLREISGRPVLSTPAGGLVALDTPLAELWQLAQGKNLAEVQEQFQAAGATPTTIAGAAACLAEAGLLLREPDTAQNPVQNMPVKEGPHVSAVIVNYNSKEWLETCIPSLLEQDYAPLEVVVVDNGSHDGALEWLATAYPQVERIALETPLSLSAAINYGVKAAGSEYLLMLNPDVYLADGCIAQLVQTAENDPACAAVAAKLRFWWAPKFLNGMGNFVGPFSWGSDIALGHLDLGQYDGWEHVPSVCFAAALIRRKAWEESGPADADYPMYYEDTDWSYRARLLGWTLRIAPQAVVYHAFGAKRPTGEPDTLSPAKLRRVVYGRYRFALKNTAESVWRFLRNYGFEDLANFTRSLLSGKWSMAGAYLQGWGDVFRERNKLRAARRDLFARRKINDAELFALQKDIPMVFSWHGLPELTWDNIVNYYTPLILANRTKPMPEQISDLHRPHFLIVSNDIVDKKMAGPGMRYLEMARTLSEHMAVTLAIPATSSLEVPGVNIVGYDDKKPASLQVLVTNSDVTLISGYMVQKFPFLGQVATRLVVDWYDPFALENLHYYLHEPIDAQLSLSRQAEEITNQLAKIGDFFICGNERQRDYWLGVLTANGRVNPLTFRNDPTLYSLIDVVGVGLPERELKGRPLLRGIHPQVPEDARIVLWGGGIWNWLDPLTLVEAWPEVIRQVPQARLVFLGTRHPNPLVPEHEMARKTMQRAEELGEKDGTILFIEWLAYEEREALLGEANIGVTLHPVHIETRYSIRTRVLDYLWARLPILITEGDVTSEWVKQYALGEVVPPHDPATTAQALVRLLARPKAEWAPAFEEINARYAWPRVVQPLLNFVRNGELAPDRTSNRALDPSRAVPLSALARARYIWRTEGTRALLFRGWRYIQWRLARS